MAARSAGASPRRPDARAALPAFTAGGRVTDLGSVSFDQAQRGSVTLPEAIKAGTRLKVAVVFDDTPLMATAR
ncbi:hypothetical protein [Nonomuraea jabiensis]|uniref:Uncharacterized protein n=1 Tax=Nonomuraea jabiensis TaxID=882448 RepID=A0A7W9LG46_9ACTN|nr:hypothetical protein [Nonomuraea jabiensis]MBB5782576.1 hypothetical protein [Nonomuraea jabiensis]